MTFAPDNDEGLHAYVIERSEWGRVYSRIEYAASLAEAKRDYGWTRELYVSIRVRRARIADVSEQSVTRTAQSYIDDGGRAFPIEAVHRVHPAAKDLREDGPTRWVCACSDPACPALVEWMEKIE